jgi:hypothetical protein
LVRECARYDLDYDRASQAYYGTTKGLGNEGRAWWDYLILVGALGVFIWLGVDAQIPTLAMNFTWVSILVAILIASAIGGAWALWRATRFS